ncbi:MAG TPA: SsrA-binding protein SmpB [Gemmatimonadaceae bacterium]|nr:SsrA-binding protein SmpB [Gemmatimonadaceae bacterium]
MPRDDSGSSRKIIISNRRAGHDYHLLETFDAGIVLTGTEVKSLRAGKGSVADAFGMVRGGEVWLENMHIPPYESGGYVNHDPTRSRKLLLHRREIRRLIGALEREGLTLVPLEVYFENGWAKVKLALARGKKLHDKREALRRRDAEREMARALRRKA